MAFPSVPERSPTRRRPDSACCYEIWRCSRHFRGSFAADSAGLSKSAVVCGANELSAHIRHGLAWVPRSLGRPLPADRYVMLELHVCAATLCRWNAGWKNRPPRCGGRWPTRRRILDLLRQRPLITGEVAAQFAISRIAVMRHLEVLSEAGLVTSRKRGRERWHYLNAVPLQQLHRRWAEPVAAGLASALLRLADTVEAEDRHMESNRPTIDVALDIEIAGTPAAVFAALTKDVGGWWGHPFVPARSDSLA